LEDPPLTQGMGGSGYSQNKDHAQVLEWIVGLW
jgi:hypothetical protein